MLTTQVTTLSTDSIEQFQRSLSAHGRSEHTVKSYGSDLRQLLLEVGISSIGLLATDEEPVALQETGGLWLTASKRKLSAKTVGRRLTSLRAFTRWAGQPGMFVDYIAPTPAKSIPEPLPEGIEGVYTMLDKCEHPQLRLVIAMCGLAGFRISEALTVPAKNINFADGLITVRGKGDKTRTVPMSDRLASMLMEPAILRYNDATLVAGTGGEPMGDRLARRSITRLGARCRLKKQVHSHMLRATFATHLMNSGVNIRTVQEILGHANVTTTEVYTAVTIDNMREAVKGL